MQRAVESIPAYVEASKMFIVLCPALEPWLPEIRGANQGDCLRLLRQGLDRSWFLLRLNSSIGSWCPWQLPVDKGWSTLMGVRCVIKPHGLSVAGAAWNSLRPRSVVSTPAASW